MLNELIKKRALPPLLSREEMLDIMQHEVYGYLPEKPEKMSWKLSDNLIDTFLAGKATLKKCEITVTVNGTDFTFPVNVVIPTKKGPHPFFVHINFRDNVPDLYMPTEEIVDMGYAVLSFCYNDVTKDDNDFTDGLAGVLYKNKDRDTTDAGKIAMWAWAAQRVMDFAQTVDSLDKSCAIICGHSRLGKTALFTAATDERFNFAFSNNSGCSGAAITRDKKGETVRDIYEKFPFWFCKEYEKYKDKERSMPFDQHYLTALIAPRFLYVSSSSEDEWADPESEFLNCIVTTEEFKKYGKNGFIAENRLPRIGDKFHQGEIGYHLRAGLHFFGREDWKYVIEFIEKHR